MTDSVLPPYSSSTDPSHLARIGTYHPSQYHSNDQATGSQCGGKSTIKRRKTRSNRTRRCKKPKRGKNGRYTGKRKTQNKRCRR